MATGRDSKVTSENFYWLSTKPDELDWGKTRDTAVTPQSAYADMTGLQDLVPVALRVQAKPVDSACSIPIAVHPMAAPTIKPVVAPECEQGLQFVQMTVSNPTKTLAFMVHLRLVKSDGEDVIPAFFEDNFISLLPGESRYLAVFYRSADVGKAPAHLEVSGWNAQSQNIALH